MITKRRLISLACTGGLAVIFPDAIRIAAAESASRMLVGFGAGGAIDVIARMLVEGMKDYAPSFIVDNRPGAGGRLALGALKSSPADGTAMILTPASSVAVFPHVYKSPGYDAFKDFAPVSLVAIVPNILIATRTLPVSSVKELIALAKRRPNELHYGSAGIGGSVHLAAELFRSMTSVQLVHVPYKGGGPALIDLIGGQIEILFPDALAGSPHIRAGKVKPLAVTSNKRLPSLPQLPTIAESGVAGYDSVGWYGIVAPVRTSAQIVEALSASISIALRSPDVKEKLSAQAAEPVGGTPSEFKAHIASEASKWAKVIKAAGIRAE